MAAKSTNAESSKKSLPTPAAKSILPSERVAARRSAMSVETVFSGLSEQDVFLCLMALLNQLHFNVMSNDVWTLSMMAAQKQAEHLGIDAETFIEVMKRNEAARSSTRSKNPMASMF